MNSLKRVVFICIIISVIFFSHMAKAQGLVPLFPYDSILSLWSPVIPPIAVPRLSTPLPIAASPILPPASPFIRTAQIPTATTPVIVPTVITTNWLGSWTSFVDTTQFGPMTLTLTEDLTTGTFTGTVLLELNSLIPVALPVSGAYTGVGLSISLSSSIFSTLVPVTTGGGPFAVTTLVPVDYILTLDFSIVAGAEIIGTYTINSTLDSDFGSIYLTVL